MSEKIAESAERDGGQAFPQPITVGPSGDVYPAYPGMSLRDWFAGQALKGMLASGDAACENYAEAAHYAFTYADSMLAERSK